MTYPAFTPTSISRTTPSTTRYPDVGILTSATTGLVDFINSKGGDADRILGMSGVDSEQLSSPILRMDLKQYCKVFEEAARQTQDDNFGLKFGYQFMPESLGFLGYVGICSNTLGEALHNVVNSFPMHQQGTLLRLEMHENTCRLDYQVQYDMMFCKRQDAELSLGMFLNIMRQALGKHWSPDQIHFEHVRPEAWREHSKLFNAPVYFDQQYNSLFFQRHLLEKPMPTKDSRLLSIVLEGMKLVDKNTNLVSSNNASIDAIKSKIERCLLEGYPTLKQVSDHLNIPCWTLQRRLYENGLNFSELTDQVRQQLAVYYLKRTNLPVSDIALRLGYSEISSFSRAFRRWHQLSPKQWRSASAGLPQYSPV